MKRPESARLKFPVRDALFGGASVDHQSSKYLQETTHTPVKEEQDSSKEQEEDDNMQSESEKVFEGDEEEEVDEEKSQREVKKWLEG